MSAGRRLCAHADADGRGMHWLEPGERCPAVSAEVRLPLAEAQRILRAMRHGARALPARADTAALALHAAADELSARVAEVAR